MQAQKCKICGERHHRYEPHQFPDEAQISDDQETRDVPGEGLPFSVDMTDAEPSAPLPKSSAKFDRNTYQRGYMRKRRAAAKKEKMK